MVQPSQSASWDSVRAVVIAPATSQPRFHRRVATLLECGLQPTVYSFRRGYYEVNDFPPGIPLVDLGPLKDGHYVARVPALLRAVRRLRQAEAKVAAPPIITYAFGLDNAVLARAAGIGRRLVYEIGDLRVVGRDRGFYTRMLSSLERKVLRRTNLLVVTAPGFLRDHRTGNPDLATVVVENRVPRFVAEMHPRPSAQPTGTPVRVGVVGLLRYKATLVPLLHWIAARPGSFELHVHGDGPLADAIRGAASRHRNVFYHGPFRNPVDLKRVYSTIDLCYCVYDSRDPNVRIAVPNKLYEAPYFGVPLIAASNTELARRVTSLNIGLELEFPRPGFLDPLELLRDPSHVDSLKQRALGIGDAMLIDDSAPLLEGLRHVMFGSHAARPTLPS